MPPKGKDESLESLKTLVQSTTSLITQLENDLHSAALENVLPDSSNLPTSTTNDATTPVNVLSLAHDSATLIKAHTTKLSLLIINEPFTPTAIIKVLRELVAGPIPGLASAVQLCAPDTYTSVARQDLAWKCYRVLKEVRGFVEIIPLDGNILSDHLKNGEKGDKGSLVATGVIWAACDDVILLRKLGIAGLLVKKVEEYRDTIQDVLDELKEWSEEVDEDDDDDDDDDDDQDVQQVTDQLQNTHVSAQEMLDDMMSSQHIPHDDPDRIRERLDSCLKRLRLTTLLYTAILKRRLKTLPSLPTDQPTTIARRLDEVLPILKNLTDRFEDVACAFYELDPGAIDKAMNSCFSAAFAASTILKESWDGSNDAFTEWADKFQISIKKPD